MCQFLIKCYLFYSIWEHFFEMLIKEMKCQESSILDEIFDFMHFSWIHEEFMYLLSRNQPKVLISRDKECFALFLSERKKTFFLYIFLSLKEIMKCFAFHRENRRFSLYKTWIYDSCHKNIFDILIEQDYVLFLYRHKLCLCLTRCYASCYTERIFDSL